MQKRKLPLREVCLLCAPLLVFVGMLAVPTAKNWLAGFTQNRLYIKNNFHEPLAKVSVCFLGNECLVFQDVPSGGQQWQPFEREWGEADSNRLLKVQGVSSTGRRIGSNDLLVTEQDNSTEAGAKFNVVVHTNGEVELNP